MTAIDDKLIEALLKKALAPAVISRGGLAILTQCFAEINRYASERITPTGKKRGEYLDAGHELRCDPQPSPHFKGEYAKGIWQGAWTF